MLTKITLTKQKKLSILVINLSTIRHFYNQLKMKTL